MVFGVAASLNGGVSVDECPSLEEVPGWDTAVKRMQGSSRVCGSTAAAFCDPVVWFQVDVQDPRFQAIFTSHLFSLDPSHPNYRKTKAMQSILAEKQRRREEQQRHLEDKLDAQEATPSHRQAAMTQEAAAERRENDSETMASKKDMDPSLSLLVKSIKSKTQQFQARKKQKTA